MIEVERRFKVPRVILNASENHHLYAFFERDFDRRFCTNRPESESPLYAARVFSFKTRRTVKQTCGNANRYVCFQPFLNRVHRIYASNRNLVVIPSVCRRTARRTTINDGFTSPVRAASLENVLSRFCERTFR